MLESTLPREELVRRLQKLIAPRFALFRSRTESPFRGEVNEARCTLRYRPFYNNGFQRLLDVELRPQGVGTLLEGSFRLQRDVFVVFAVWGVMCLSVSGIYIQEFLRDRQAFWNGTGWIPFVILAFLALIVWFGLWLSGFSEQKTLQILEEELQVRQVVGALIPK